MLYQKDYFLLNIELRRCLIRLIIIAILSMFTVSIHLFPVVKKFCNTEIYCIYYIPLILAKCIKDNTIVQNLIILYKLFNVNVYTQIQENEITITLIFN